MKSIGDLLKHQPLRIRTEQIERKMAELLDDPLIVQFRAKYPQLNQQSLRIHMNKLYQYVTEYRNCSQCPGLENCPNDFCGHYTKLSTETINGQVLVYDHKVPCKKLISFEQQQAIQNRVRSFYVDETALKQGYSASEILENDMKRSGAVLTIIEYIEQTRREGLQTHGLYMLGSLGTGKTFLMSYVLYELARADFTGIIIYMPEFIEELKSMFQEPQKLRDTIEMLKGTDLLVFDDIGAENITPWVRDHVLGSILNYRMNRKPTFYTSNYDMHALLKHFGHTREGEDIHKAERLMNRIQPFVKVVLVEGQNQRGYVKP